MTSILTAIFLFIRIVSNPIANTFQKILSEKIQPVCINFYTYLILSIFCILFLNINTAILTKEFIILTLIAGFLCSLGNVFLIKAVNIGEISVLGPINSYKGIIGLVSAFILLNEIPSIIAFFGILLIIFGSRLIFNTTKEGFSLSIFKRQDIKLRFAALILTGTEAAILKKIILISSVEACFIFWCLTGLLWSLVFVITEHKSIKIQRQNIIQLFIIALCLGLMQYSTNFVFKNMNVGYALALFQLSSIITVFIGYKLFKEKAILKRLLGSIIMILGSVLIILW